MQKLIFLSLLIFVGFSGNAQWNLTGNNYTTGTLGIGTSSAPATNKLEVRSTNDVSLFFLRQDKNNGGSGDAVYFRDDRGYGGNNTGTTFKIESWKGLNYQGGALANFVTIDNGFYKSRFYVDNNTGFIGVGTVQPTDPLEIRSPSAELNLLIRNTTTSQGARMYLTVFPEKASIQSDRDFTIRTNYGGPWTDKFILTHAGNVGIGTLSPDAKLTVKGSVHAEEVTVDLSVPAPDYVFEKNYNLRPLAEVESYININKHLPEVPAAKEMEANGLDLGEMNMLLLKKVEELTLYILEQEKRIKHLENDKAK